MDDPVVQTSVDSPRNTIPSKLPDGSAQRTTVEGKSSLNSKLGVSKSRFSSTPQSSSAIRRNSTGGLGEKQAVSAKTKQDSASKTSKSTAPAPCVLRRSLPEMRRNLMCSDTSKSSGEVGVRNTKKLGPNSPVSRTSVRPPSSSNASKSDGSFAMSTNSSSRKATSSSALESTASTTSSSIKKKSVSRLSSSSTPSAALSSSATSGLRKTSKVSSSLWEA